MRGERRRGLYGWALILALSVCFPSLALAQSDRQTLEEAQRLAGRKRFHEAEQRYRELLRRRPGWRDAAVGLAQVVLWGGRYREARALFLDLIRRDQRDVEAIEGAATAAYWQGDYRTAANEFRRLAERYPDRPLARRSLSEIALAARGQERLVVEAIDDDQPYRFWRTEATSSIFTDPLTRWDVTAGSCHLVNPVLHADRDTPYVSLGNEIVLPWQSLTIRSSAGAFRWPDGVARPIGGLTLQFRTSPFSSMFARSEHRELLASASATLTHTAVTRTNIGWTRYAPGSWVAGVEAGHLRYFDRNRGKYAQAYALWPMIRGERITASVGGSAAIRHTDDSRFYLDAVASTISTGGGFDYQYRGSYTPYWTPQHLRERRAIVLIARTLARGGELKAQGEFGTARDRAIGYAPSHGSQPLPTAIMPIEFQRNFHPYRVGVDLSIPLSQRYRVDAGVARTSTVFYRANEFRAIVVRYR